MSLNDELSNLFDTLASMLQLKGEPVFKAIAFQKVSRLLSETSVDIRKAAADGSLAEMEGIGPSSRKIIEEYVQTGKSSALAEIGAEIPPGLIPMLGIPGLGAKTVALLWKERNIHSIEELSAAIESGRLAGLKGIGEKKIEQIKQGIALLAQAGERMGVVLALPLASELLELVRKLAGVERAEIAGSLRRRRETIGDVDLCRCARAGGGGRQGVHAVAAGEARAGAGEDQGVDPDRSRIAGGFAAGAAGAFRGGAAVFHGEQGA
jgi:DNA polymerase (family 10)